MARPVTVGTVTVRVYTWCRILYILGLAEKVVPFGVPPNPKVAQWEESAPCHIPYFKLLTIKNVDTHLRIVTVFKDLGCDVGGSTANTGGSRMLAPITLVVLPIILIEKSYFTQSCHCSRRYLVDLARKPIHYLLCSACLSTDYYVARMIFPCDHNTSATIQPYCVCRWCTFPRLDISTRLHCSTNQTQSLGPGDCSLNRNKPSDRHC